MWSSVEASGCNSQKTSRPTGQLLHHGNEIPSTAQPIQERIKDLQWVLPEHPPYGQDLALNDFYLYSLLKNNHVRTRFTDDEEVETEVCKWLGQQSKDFYAAGFDALVKRWNKCIDVGVGYVEE
jgi:hypothetical protein